MIQQPKTTLQGQPLNPAFLPQMQEPQPSTSGASQSSSARLVRLSQANKSSALDTLSASLPNALDKVSTLTKSETLSIQAIQGGEELIKHLDAQISDVLDETPSAIPVFEGLQSYIDSGVIPQNKQARELIDAVNATIDPAIREIEAEIGQPLQPAAKRNLFCDALAKFISCDFESLPARVVASFGNIGIRTGAIVFVTTFLRQLLAYGIAKGLTNLSPAAKKIAEMTIGNVCMAVGPVCNGIGAIYDEVTGQATTATRISRGVLGIAGVAAPVVASVYSDAIMPQMAPMAAALTVAYINTGRDTLQPMFTTPTGQPLNKKAVALSAVFYAANQLAVCEAMDAFSPDSGVGLGASGKPLNLRHDAGRSLTNTLGEVGDDTTNAIAHAAFNDEQLRVRQEITPKEKAWHKWCVQQIRTAVGRQGLFMPGFVAAYGSYKGLLSLGYSESAAGHLSNLCISVVLAAMYPFFMYIHDTKAPTPAIENVEAAPAPVEMELRHRRPAPLARVESLSDSSSDESTPSLSGGMQETRL